MFSQIGASDAAHADTAQISPRGIFKSWTQEAVAMLLFALVYFFKDASVAVVSQRDKKITKQPPEWRSRGELEMNWDGAVYRGSIILTDGKIINIFCGPDFEPNNTVNHTL